jgi:exodeoxyribonuclease V alpha subunit
LATVVENLPEPSPGEHCDFKGNRITTKRGPHFKAGGCDQTLPATVTGNQGYLVLHIIKSIGPRFAERIVGIFKEETLDAIESAP